MNDITKHKNVKSTAYCTVRPLIKQTKKYLNFNHKNIVKATFMYILDTF